MVAKKNAHVALVSVSKLNPAEYNPRKISKEDMDALKRSITEFGFVENIVANKDGTIISGHQRYSAAKALGHAEVPVYYVDIDKDREKALNVAMNRISGEFDMGMLPELIASLPKEMQELTGFSDTEISQMLDAAKLEGEIEEDEAPPVPTEAKTKVGDLYQLGNHSLLCGDSTSIDAVEKLMDGKKADMVFTDPPYGISYQSNMREKSDRFAVLANDEQFITDWIPLLDAYSKGFVFIWTAWKVLPQWIEFTKQLGDLSNVIVWDKGGGGIGDLEGTFATDFEIALVFNRGAKITGKRLGSVWDIGKDRPTDYQHPTQKPVSLAATAINNVTLRENIVLDLFGGSGSTLIACEQTNRKCYMMELDPKYCDVIVARWENLTGNTAKLL